MTVKANKVFNAVMYIPLLFGLFCLGFLSYVFLWPPYKAYVIANPQNHKVEYLNDSIIITRDYCINSRVPITVTRDLVQVTDGMSPETRFSLPQTVQVYELGCHSLKRIFNVPDNIPAGNYRLVFQATWQANAFRDDSVRLPELIVAIPPKKH